MKQNLAVTRGAGPRAREASLIKVFTDDRNIGVRKHAVLRAAMSGHDGGGGFLLAGVDPPAFVLRGRCDTARVALKVIDKLTENVEMVAWLIRVAARRSARRIHCVFVLWKIHTKFFPSFAAKFRANNVSRPIAPRTCVAQTIFEKGTCPGRNKCRCARVS